MENNHKLHEVLRRALNENQELKIRFRKSREDAPPATRVVIEGKQDLFWGQSIWDALCTLGLHYNINLEEER